MLVIVGLGNPGGAYANHRHNIGYRAVEAIHERHRFGPWRQRFRSQVAEGTLAGRKVLLMKPATYMNLSGEAVGEATRFYKVPNADLVAIHDELDLPPGKVRIKAGGGDGGHNGLRSLTAHLGPDYRRVRIGIGHPGHKDRVSGYVLHDFAKADSAWIDPLIDSLATHATMLAEDKDAALASRLHLDVARALGEHAGGKEKPAKDKATRSQAASEETKPAEGSSQPAQRNSEADSGNAPQGPLARGLRRLFGGRSD
ncbi:MAG: aminoacyl-tRNA hydrolase [Bauldia sp.]|nr:aminoacyl-tRNA hydrolase [Bauldia sp.]